MKPWAAATVLLYVVILLFLTLPLLLLLYGEWWGPKGGGVGLEEAMGIYKDAVYWIWLAVMGICQAFLLFAPIQSHGRPTARRPILVPILTAGFLLANLALCGLVCVLCLLFSDKGVMIFAILGELVAHDAANLWGLILGKAGVITSTNVQFVFGIITATSAFWMFWGLVFYGFAKNDDPQSLIQRSTRWLLRGSIAELLVAIPSHIWVRNRHDCCAPAATFWGITTGIAVLLLAFGPGVFFLFVERASRLRPRPPGEKSEVRGQKAEVS